MISYGNVVLDLFENLIEYNLSMILREQNNIADSLSTSTNIFKIPIYPNRKYEIKVKHRPSVLDNMKQWQVFEDDQPIKR